MSQLRGIILDARSTPDEQSVKWDEEQIEGGSVMLRTCPACGLAHQCAAEATDTMITQAKPSWKSNVTSVAATAAPPTGYWITLENGGAA